MRSIIKDLLEVNPGKRLVAEQAAKRACFLRVDSLDSRRDPLEA
jgi:hypothetical protein